MMKCLCNPAPAALLCFLLPFSALADTLFFENGSSVEGPILAEKEDLYVIDLGHAVMTVPKAKVVERRKEEISKERVGNGAVAEDIYFSASEGSVIPVRELVKKLGEAVVEVRTRVGLGSGFVIHPDGYLITNQHVISGENQLTVTIFRRRGREFEKVQYKKIRIVAMDPVRDLALLKIEPDSTETFQYVPLGSSESIEQGQTVFAVGSPLGLDRTVSQGIVSLARRVMGPSVLIQTTTQINPGNSGGPLFNLQGHVIGVNNRKAAAVGVEGLGFSIPSSAVKTFIRQRDAFAFDPRNPNAGYRYLDPPRRQTSARPGAADKTGNAKKSDKTKKSAGDDK